MMTRGLYEPLAFYDEAGALMAYAWQAVLPQCRNVLLDYFAVLPQYRGSGVGTAVLKELAAYYAPRKQSLIIECEHPAEAIATMVSNGGIYIEDYRDLEQQAWEIAHVDLIEQDLLDQPRDIVKVHMYLAPDENPAEILPLFKERLEACGVEYKLETSGIEQEDWQNAWKKYYHAMDIGQRLAIVPGWETYDTDRIVITMDPGMAFGTGTHETTSLCLETLDSMVCLLYTSPSPRDA